MRAAPESLAEALRRRGLAAPARLLLDAHRPLRPLMAEMGVFFSPVLRPLLGRRYRALQDLLEHDTTYDQLIESLDDAEHR